MANDDRFYDLLNNNISEIKASLNTLHEKVDRVEIQATRTNGRVSRLEDWRRSVDKILKALSVKKGGNVQNLSAKTVYVLALVVMAVVSLLAVALGNPIDWLKP